MKINIEKEIESLIDDKNFAVGNDIVFLPDFSKSFNPLFKKKVYTDQEIVYCEQFDDPNLRFASTWAAKEAIYKAIKQINPKPISFKKIEIYRSKISGVPTVKLPDIYKEFNFSLSISHDGDYVWAVAMLKKINLNS